ncbi:MAG TPA: hypothetical protein PKJ33_00275 [Alphaproteobacteria bacterium]|nr:hypothetical protein [Alphaproteobacteria bacterium]
MQEKIDIYKPGALLNPKIKIEPNYYNINGERCSGCSYTENCELFKRDFKNLCFEEFRKQMDPLNPYKKEIFIIVDSILYHLKKFDNSKSNPMSHFEQIDCLTSLGVSNKTISERANICLQFLGKQVLDILRSRGYLQGHSI